MDPNKAISVLNGQKLQKRSDVEVFNGFGNLSEIFKRNNRPLCIPGTPHEKACSVSQNPRLRNRFLLLVEGIYSGHILAHFD